MYNMVLYKGSRRCIINFQALLYQAGLDLNGGCLIRARPCCMIRNLREVFRNIICVTSSLPIEWLSQLPRIIIVRPPSYLLSAINTIVFAVQGERTYDMIFSTIICITMFISKPFTYRICKIVSCWSFLVSECEGLFAKRNSTRDAWLL